MESAKEQTQKQSNINGIEQDENNEIFIEQINIDPKRDIYDKLQLLKMEQINKNKQQKINTNNDGLYQFDQKNSENLVNFSGNICNFAAFKGKKFIISKQQVHLTQFQKKLKITFFISFLTFVFVLVSLIATLKWISDEEKRTDEVLNGYYYNRRILSTDIDFQSIQNDQNLDFNSQLSEFNLISETLNTKNVQKIINVKDKRLLSQQNKEDDDYNNQQNSHYYDYNYDDENEYYSKEDLKGYRIYSFILFAAYILFELMFVCFKNKILKISNELVEKEQVQQQQQLPNQQQQNVQINLNDAER
ncbi:hypothetical protein PPERSA_04968 [Pseudocohnilembus persalinus]|uniref:Transmembrane protein n=1 Tax=Pseudocohnilembus persalinus TaxID=266149 RepID=A0A0V0QVB1_PSEPJ|nr:hypothetical protein PPERSA_04968 [Pseudocohnilembus persalinus]|eukprot:KRX06355.1 hypothetical protein PPERSA_04968 [Pseudocohnilembus persalinus]